MMRETFGAPPAVRQLDASLIDDPGFQRRYAAETGVLRGLDEPWVAVTTSFVVDGAGRIVATVRPQVAGPSVAALLEQNPRGFDPQTSAAIAMDVLSALSALHERGVAHRGELVEHVIVGADGTCVLVDEGLAPRWTEDSTQAAVAGDLRSFADLVARCLGVRPRSRRGRPTPPRGTRSAGPGIAHWIPRPAANPLRPLVTRATSVPAPGAETAAALLTELGTAAARAFEDDWDMRARERLAVASQSFAPAPFARAPFAPASAPAPRPDPRSRTRPASRNFTPAPMSMPPPAPTTALWPLPRAVRIAVLAVAALGATVSFLIAAFQGGAAPPPPTAATPQANPLPVVSVANLPQPSATAAAPVLNSPAPSQSSTATPSPPPPQPSTAPAQVSVSSPASTTAPPVQAAAIANAGFESGSLSGWNCSGTDSVVANPVHSGAFALQGAASNSDDAQCSQSIAVAPNTTYTLSAWVNGSYAFIGATGTGSNDTDTWTAGTNGAFAQLSMSFTTGSATQSVTIYVHGWYAQGTYYADDFSLKS